MHTYYLNGLYFHGDAINIILLCVLSSFSIILKRKRELVALLVLSYECLVTVNVL